MIEDLEALRDLRRKLALSATGGGNALTEGSVEAGPPEDTQGSMSEREPTAGREPSTGGTDAATAAEREPTRQAGFRLPVGMIRRLDAYARRLRRETGIPVTRTAAVVGLLEFALRVKDAPDSGELAGEAPAP